MTGTMKGEPISDEQFLELVDRMAMENKSSWNIRMDRNGAFLDYNGRSYAITGRQIDIMFRFVHPPLHK